MTTTVQLASQELGQATRVVRRRELNLLQTVHLAKWLRSLMEIQTLEVNE